MIEITNKTKQILNLDLEQEWDKEYLRIGNMYAFWGGVMVVFFYPTGMFPQWNAPKDNEALWYFFRLYPSVLVAITLLLFKKFKFRHEIVFEIIAFSIYMGGAYWVNSNDWLSHLISSITLFLTGAVLTILRPKLFVINFTWVIFINLTFYVIFCKRSVGEFFTEKGSAIFLVSGMAAFAVAIYRYYLLKNNFKQRFALRQALNQLEFKNQELNNAKEDLQEKHEEIIVQHEQLKQQNEEILTQRDEIEEQRNVIERKNHNIISGINYAKRIQEAILPRKETFFKHFKDFFVFYKPKDIVSGDFYWLLEHENLVFFAVVDCTGHSVPGAFMSMLGTTMLDSIILGKELKEPSEILYSLDKEISLSLKQDVTGSQDGMDILLGVLDKANNVLKVAGAHNPLLYIQNQELKMIRTSHSGIGGTFDTAKKFETHIIDISQPTILYLFSDGFQDQFGGEKNRKYSSKRFYQLLYDIHAQTFSQQEKIIEKELSDWVKMAREEQIDDITVMGIYL
jgi:serine phosphatase RsbU (regulator of sigma subunit)